MLSTPDPQAACVRGVSGNNQADLRSRLVFGQVRRGHDVRTWQCLEKHVRVGRRSADKINVASLKLLEESDKNSQKSKISPCRCKGLVRARVCEDVGQRQKGLELVGSD